MEVTVSDAQGKEPATVLHLNGDLDANTGSTVLEKAREVVAAGARHLVIDMTHVRFMSSAGIRTLHQIYLLLRPAGDQAAVMQGLRDGTYSAHNVRLMSPNANVHAVLTTSGMDMVLKVHPDLESALAGFDEG